MALVTSVKKVRKHMDVEIDGERFHVSLPIFQERPLEEGMDVDLEAYRQFLLIRPGLWHDRV